MDRFFGAFGFFHPALPPRIDFLSTWVLEIDLQGMVDWKKTEDRQDPDPRLRALKPDQEQYQDYRKSLSCLPNPLDNRRRASEIFNSGFSGNGRECELISRWVGMSSQRLRASISSLSSDRISSLRFPVQRSSSIRATEDQMAKILEKAVLEKSEKTRENRKTRKKTDFSGNLGSKTGPPEMWI